MGERTPEVVEDHLAASVEMFMRAYAPRAGNGDAQPA
jgi:hypothetical protein